MRKRGLGVGGKFRFPLSDFPVGFDAPTAFRLLVAACRLSCRATRFVALQSGNLVCTRENRPVPYSCRTCVCHLISSHIYLGFIRYEPSLPPRMRQLLLAFTTVTLGLGHCATAQEPNHRFFPDHVGFVPFRANHEEPRMGIQQQIEATRMDVALGGMLDVYQLYTRGDTITMGAEFFGYALSRTFGDYQFKIDAADGYFGVHFTLHNATPLSFRLRVMHLSGHLVDGRFYDAVKSGALTREPFSFSRNFVELAVAADPAIRPVYSRMYFGGSYAFAVNPRNLEPWAAIGGLEVALPSSPSFYGAYNASLLGVPTYSVSNAVELGVKFGTWNARGLRLYFMYYNGLDWFGQFYDERIAMAGVGLTFDLY